MNPAGPKLRLYLDTTIPSYVFAVDSPARMEITRRLMRFGRQWFDMVISDVVLRELDRAAEPKRTLLLETVKGLHILASSPESDELAEAYIKARALPRGSMEDARHVAVATLHRLDAVVSWNFGHLVNIRRRRAIAEVNVALGLSSIEILSPEEVLPE